MNKVLNPSQLEGRLKNAAAQFLLGKLIVPKIFLEAKWPKNNRVDVLAIDRAGAGDIHVVETRKSLKDAYLTIPGLIISPAHYKYIATFEEEGVEPIEECIEEERLYAVDGIGRIGVIAVWEDPEDRSLSSDLVITPERFRLEHKYLDQIDRFLEEYTPDLEIREK